MKLGACRTADPADDRANPALGSRLQALAFGVLFVSIGGVVAVSLATGYLRSASTIARLVGRPDAAVAGQPEPYWGHGEAYVDSDTADANAAPDTKRLCDVESARYQSGKGGGWKQTGRNLLLSGPPTLVLRDGRLVGVSPSTPARFEPFVGDAPQGPLPRNLQREIPGPRVQVQCLRSGTVFVDGCVYPAVGDAPPVLDRCSDAAALVLTQGPRRTRIAGLARGLAIPLGLTCVGLGGLLWFLLARLRGRSSEAGLALAVGLAPRGLGGVANLAARRRMNWLELSPGLLAPLGLGLLAVVSAVPGTFALASLGLLVPLALAKLAGRRRHELADVRQAILDRPTSGLASAEGELVELAVRVSARAPVTPTPLAESPAAHASLQIWQRIVRGSGRNRTVDFVHVFSGVPHGADLPIEDSTGLGTLDLSEAILDFPAQQTILPAHRLPEGVRKAANLAPGDYLVRESVLRPGDPLFVMGPVRRVLDASADGHVAYRAAPTTARVANTDGPAPAGGTWAPGSGHHDGERFPLFVHAGTEATVNAALDRAIARERGVTIVSVVLAGTLGLGLVGLTLACLL